ncbi:hypothetical protein Bca52824_072436 [Brassica carinata]|uniref:Uncharacterized protein n=1 Tax=Brassica carinata TaxID=52824 RepID=A0A8X7Q8F6_BRACI|nr:hypothetical protein Bca52824_072436 [Brassica carinata]
MHYLLQNSPPEQITKNSTTRPEIPKASITGKDKVISNPGIGMTKASQLLAVLKTGSAIEVRLLRFLENIVKMIKAMMMMNRQATPRQILRKSRGPPRYFIHNIVDEKVDVGHNSLRAVDTAEAMSTVIVNACYRQDRTISSYLNELIRHSNLLMK